MDFCNQMRVAVLPALEARSFETKLLYRLRLDLVSFRFFSGIVLRLRLPFVFCHVTTHPMTRRWS